MKSETFPENWNVYTFNLNFSHRWGEEKNIILRANLKIKKLKKITDNKKTAVEATAITN